MHALGDLVVVPFRRRPSPGVILSISESSAFAEKAQEIIVSPHHSLGADFVTATQWLATRTLQSTPSLTKAWLRHIPKKFPPFSARTPKRDKQLSVDWSAQPETALARHVRSIPCASRLILVPWKWQAEALAKELGATLLTGDTAPATAARTWRAFICGESPLLVTTRVGAWLALYADETVLLEPENDEHKQEDQAPRYDARLLFGWMHRELGLSLATFGRTPPLHLETAAPAIDIPLQLILRHPKGRSVLPHVELDALERLLAHDGPRIIIHGTRGTSSRLRCRDCGHEWRCPRCQFILEPSSRRAVCRLCHHAEPLPLSCPSCGGVELQSGKRGLETLEAIAKREGIDVEWRDHRPESLFQPIPENAMVLLLDPTLLRGASEDIRRTERETIHFRHLTSLVQAAHGTLLVQAEDEAQANRWQEKLTSEGVAKERAEELHDRRLFGYPPTSRLVKLIAPANQAARLGEALKKALSGTVRGPFTIEFRSNTRAPECIFHALYPAHTPFSALEHELTPFAGEIKIDLDPTSFFR